jgi:hypothetical protein
LRSQTLGKGYNELRDKLSKRILSIQIIYLLNYVVFSDHIIFYFVFVLFLFLFLFLLIILLHFLKVDLAPQRQSLWTFPKGGKGGI